MVDAVRPLNGEPSYTAKGERALTFSSSFSALSPRRSGQTTAPLHAHPGDVSLVVPVKNNQRGIDRLLTAFLHTHTPAQFPGELILVDNNSSPPLQVAPHYRERGLHVVLLSCTRLGPATARNVGAQVAQGAWILFLDSDCLPTTTTLSGYLSHLNGAVAYAGSVLAAGTDVFSRYYESQAILTPPIVVHDSGSEHPAYLITANALVWKQALLQIGGFNEQIQGAAGEDIDLGLRLWDVGPLAYAPHAHVLHVFEGGVSAFVKRFVRYGRGNRVLQRYYPQADLAPRPFSARVPSFWNRLLAGAQYASLWWGYHCIL